MKKKFEYNGFEQGPIRPPSEANSLLIRVTRNCPWNKCRFCPVYKGTRFEKRPLAHVIEDIDKVSFFIDRIKNLSGGDIITGETVRLIGKDLDNNDINALHAALNWISSGMESVFLQDANSLILKTSDIVAILDHIRKRFPFVKRITSYARSATIAKKSDEEMNKIALAGLNRIHIGMESGSDNVLKMVEKGADKDTHIIAGKKVKKAGISLSEYIMPGLGGKKYSKEHALETADALNHINPDFIRIRTLAVPENIPLFEDMTLGKFEKITDIECAEELRLLIKNLNGINSFLKSDHILNLFEDLQGKLPDDKDSMLEKLDSFFELSDQDRMIYQLGRRIGLFRGVSDMKNTFRYKKAADSAEKLKITPENADHLISELMKRFI
ncbi:MAG: coproporphyrinogen III oxidase [Deltaproteobacteria bacterium]|nr:MAG: coproporphyrinogen III oxidase [Deltaproteobacteria bacterium]